MFDLASSPVLGGSAGGSDGGVPVVLAVQVLTFAGSV